MKYSIAILFLLPLLAVATDYYVLTNGNNGNDGLSWTNAWLTISNAEANVSNGDTINIGAGDYDEYVQVAGVHSLTFTSSSNAITRAFRFDTASNTIDGITLSKACDAGYRTWGGFVRLSSGAHNSTVNDCKIIDSPWASATNWFFDETNNTITSSSVDLISTGFVPGCRIFWNGVSYSNSTRGSQFRFANQGGNGFATNVATTAFTFSNNIINAESNDSTWAIISAGPDQDFYGVQFIASGGEAASNCTISGTLFSNIFGEPIVLRGNYNSITNCEFTAIHGNSAITYLGSFNKIISNYFHDCQCKVYYSSTEVVDHTGGTFYDYYVRFIIPKIEGSSPRGSNTWIVGNWFENIEGAGMNLEHSDEGWFDTLVIGNVFIGIGGEMDGGVNNTLFRSNTFYRCSYKEGRHWAATLGGAEADPITNFTFTHNLMVSSGDHSLLGNEGYMTFTYVSNIVSWSNMVAGPEITDWKNMENWTAAWGTNGGDPMFVDEFNPRGADGVPFTADDGLRPLPGSPAASIGALPVAAATETKPIAFFRALVSSNFYDYTGTNFNIDWHTNLYCFQRTGWDRAWDYGDATTNLPIFVTFDATNSISGTWSTTNWVGNRDFLWDFGDGSRSVWTKWPYVSHTFLTTGQVTVTLTVTNSATNTATHTRNYRILPGTNFANSLYYVATNGNDGNDGSFGSPYLTVTNATAQAAAGDYILVQPGWYTNEYMNLGDSLEVDGTAENPIRLIGYDARLPHITNKLSYWTFEGFEMTGGGTASKAMILTPFSEVGLTFRNFYWHDTPWRVDLLLFDAPGAGDSHRDIVIENNRAYEIAGLAGSFTVLQGTNVSVLGNISHYTQSQPDFRMDAWNVTIARNYAYAFGYTNGNHADFVVWGAYSQPLNPPTTPIGNFTIEQNWIEMPSWATQVFFNNNTLLIDVDSVPNLHDTLTVNGETLTWTNTSGTDLLIIGADEEECATNLFNNASTNPFAGPVAVEWSTATRIKLIGTNGPPQILSYAQGGAWADFTEGVDNSMVPQIVNSGVSNDFNPAFSNFVFRNNVVINFYNGMNPLSGDGQKIYNNLFYGCARNGTLITAGGRNGSCLGTDIRNNIIFDTGTTTNNGWYQNGAIATQTNMTFAAVDYNYVSHTNRIDGVTPKEAWQPGDATNQFWGFWGIPWVPADAFFPGVPMEAQQGQETNGINGLDPLWVNEGNQDFRLQTNSPLVDTGADLSATGFNYDFWGRTRPSGSWDIGPFEGGSAAAAGSTNYVRSVLGGNKAVLSGRVILR